MPASLPGLASVGWPVIDRFRIGDSFAISPHGLFIAIGFLLGAWLFARIGARRGISAEAANSIAFWSLIGAIVGARVGYVVGHWSEFAGSPVEVLYVWEGGISLIGGIVGATIANAVNIRRYGLRFFQVADSIAPALAFGIAVGRIGDLIIADHLGKPTSWFLAWVYKGGTLSPPFTCVDDVCQAQLQDGYVQIVERGSVRLLDGAGNLVAQGVGVHQAALYDMLLAWALFAVLWWFSATDRREGTTALLFVTWYGCARLLEDSLRIDKRFGPLTGSQWTALTVVLVSLALLLMFAATKRPGPVTRGRHAPPTGPAETPATATAT